MPATERDLLRIGETARLLGVTEETLRNWDRAGKVTPLRHPINGYRLYRADDVRRLLRELRSTNAPLDLFSEAVSLVHADQHVTANATVHPRKDASRATDRDSPLDQLPPCHWSLDVALDPKHRPQLWNAAATTVRRSWRKYPQEAHVLDAENSRYRRFTVEEIMLLQGFDPGVMRFPGLTDRERIGAIGDAVPPPLAKALVSAVVKVVPSIKRTALEICAGIGGLAEGAAHESFEHLLLADSSPVAGTLLATGRHWPSECVRVADVRTIPFAEYRNRIGLLSGGPPCQPWSQSGLGKGAADERDLFSFLPSLIADVRPEAFLFENVPGLMSDANRPYLEHIVAQLRTPASDLRYAVLVAAFNAADFGVAQVRRRIFVLGICDASTATVSRCFDLVSGMRTHRSPAIQDPTREVWNSVGAVIGTQPDPGGWRRWVGR